MAVYVVHNPEAGSRLAEQLLREHIQPRLQYWKEIDPTRPEPVYHVTNAAVGAKDVVQRISSLSLTVTLILMGGDGTTHEVIEAFYQKFGADLTHLQLVLIPTGTANALYQSCFKPDLVDNVQWRLHSLEAFFQGDPQSLVPLSFLQVDPDNRIATVVASHALHAAILRDSEALRSNYPGIERFKIASQENAATWFDATLILHPLKDGHVLTYDPAKHAFVPVNAALDDYLCHGDGRVEVPGVFVYMNAMLVDRLEAEFVPAPFGGLRSEPHLRRPAGSVDVVVIRPYRNPRMRKLLHEGENTKAMHDEYAQDVVQRVIFEGMYKGGTHVHFTYTSNGQVDTEGHAGGPKVVEYFRASGYEWIASADDSQAHATCVDGSITEAVRTRATISPIQGVKLWCHT